MHNQTSWTKTAIATTLVISAIVMAGVPVAEAQVLPVVVQGMVKYADGTHVPAGWTVYMENLDEAYEDEPWNGTTGDPGAAPWDYTVVGSSTAAVHTFYINVSDLTGVSKGEATFTAAGFDTKTINLTVSNMFDIAGTGTYPSIWGTHYGTFTPNQDIGVNRIYTYSCAGTGGHSEFVAFYEGGTEIANASWSGYFDRNYHLIKFAEPFILHNGTTYGYKIITGSYPQIYHGTEFSTANGTITCTNFTDANGRVSYDWIPVIRLE
jgi:hypothetical protein